MHRWIFTKLLILIQYSYETILSLDPVNNTTSHEDQRIRSDWYYRHREHEQTLRPQNDQGRDTLEM